MSQLPQKADILRQAIAKLRNKQVLPMVSVHAITTGYSGALSDLYPRLSLVERNCLHVIYERLRVADEVMDSFDKDIVAALRDKVVGDPWTAYADRLEDILCSLDIVEQLTKSYLSGKPVDVFNTSQAKS